MDTKIISYEDYIKQNKKSDITKAVSEYNELKAKRDYIETKRASDEAQKQIKTAIRQEQSRLGVKTPTLAPLATTNNTSVLDNDTGRLKLQSAYETNQQNMAKYTEQQKKNNELTQNSPVINQLNNLSKEVNNQKLIAKYNYDIAKEANHEINTWDKTGGVVTRAVSDFFNPEKLDSSNYFEQNGNRMVLPTASAIRQQNVSASYDDSLGGKIGKFATDVGYNLTKIGLSSAINTVVPYGGSALYFSDMAGDSFNQAKLDGYDDKSAALFSVIGVASEMVTEKLLGGFSGLMGGESELSSTINKTLSKIMKNDRLRSAISNAFSEGTEEFTQEFIERLNRNLVLEKNNLKDSLTNTFNKETLEDAVYSALVGMGSGGLMGATNVEINTNNTGIIPKVVDGKIDVKTYVNDLENAKANTKNQQKINNINEVLSNIDVANNVNDVYSTFGEKLLNGEIDQKLSQQNTKAETVSENNDNINILPRAKKNNVIDHYVVNEAMNNGETLLNGDNILKSENYSQNDISERLSVEVDSAMNNKNSNSKVYLGNVSQKIANKIKNLLGIDTIGRRHILSDNDIRHMINEHGNPNVEAQKGQIAITTDDIKMIPEIISSYDNIVKGTDNKLGQTIRYIKKYNDNTTYVVEVVPDKSNALLIKTMWKKPSTLTNSIAPSLTSETKGSVISSTIDNNISQNDNKVKSDISTRYSMQKNTNNTQGLDNSSFSLNKNTNQKVITSDLNEYIADAATRQEQQNIANKQVIREMIENYVEENDIKNPTLEQLQNSMDDYDMFDNMQDMSELQKAEKLYKEVAKELYEEKYAKKEVTKKLKGDNILRSSKESVPEWLGTTNDTELLFQNQKYNRENNLNEINDMTQYVDNNNHIFAIPDNLAMNLTEKTNITSNMIGELESILKNAKETKINGDNIEVKSDYWDNSTIDIKATKQGNTYIIDDIKKIAKNQDNIVGKNRSVNYNNESKSDIKNELSNDDVIRIDNETNNNKTKNIRDSYNDTVNNATNLKESKFYKNITEKSKYITEENRNKLGKIGDIQFYEGISNEESLSKASKRLQQGGEAEAKTWLDKDAKTSDSIDVAEGLILLENYQQQGNYDAMVKVAKKMREMGTKAGQAVQAYNIMARLTPEGMVKYAQSQLGEAYEVFAKNKSQSWIDENASSFDLTPQEVGFIVDTMKQVQKMEDGRAKNVKLAEINKMLTDKLPPERGSGIKAWMRTSMLFNPKTQIRNILGNAVITPVNMVGDYFASKVDKAIAKKTGVRTTGTTDAKSYIKGFSKGLFESYDDFKRGINTRDVKGNRFEIGQGKSFNDNTKLGKALNRVDSLNSFLLDFGDRGFYEAAFTNSINNQLVLNNKTTVTQEMIDIATSEALSRTWQDNNNYTKLVLRARNDLNEFASVKGYGLGDVLIPFAKTPANLTKAIVDYSPAGLISVFRKYRNLKNNISTGKNTAMEQHQFVQDLGKATAGTMLYIGAYALAKAGIATGKSDDDKDTRDFIKNTLGVSSYSIKIGDKSFTYDWAQPVAAPLSIMTNIVNSKKNDGQALFEAIVSNLDSAGSILLEQSFVKSINEVLTDNDGLASGIENAILDLPARAVPTFMKQIVDLTDSTQRQTFEYGQPLKTAKNKIIAKIPGLNQTLTPSIDSMGREIQKYGGKNNIFNVFLNPANINTQNISKGAEEIYRVYKEVGDKTIMPRVAPYYINSKGEKTILNTEQRKDYQKVSGKIIEESMQELLDNKNYENMSDEQKNSVINNIVNYSYNKAKEQVLNMEISGYKSLENWLSKGGTVASYYANKEEADYSVNSPAKYATIQNMKVDYYDYKEYQQKVNEIKEEYSGTANSNIRKQKVFDYINSLNLSKNKKIILFKMLGNYSIKDYSNDIFNYINSFELTAKEKQEIWNTLF